MCTLSLHDALPILVVFEDGLARKSEYRRFEIRDGAAGGDVASIAEDVRRRFRRYLAETGGDQMTGGARPITDRDAEGGNAGSAATEGPGDAPDPSASNPRPGNDPEAGPPRQLPYPRPV